jgi:hypothetical protein
MGLPTYSDDFYEARVKDRATRGVTSAFEYHEKVARAPVHERKVHEKLDPKGVKVREARDSVAHPESLNIMFMLDVTGSMGGVPVKVQAQLPKLMNKINTVSKVEHPQILFGAVGDEFSDKGSLQVGQFESGIEMDIDISNFWLEGGGGGSNEESYQNAIYFASRNTVADAFEKRGKKGYLFLTGDEKPYPQVKSDSINHICGTAPQGGNISVGDIVKECSEKYHIFFIFPTNASNSSNHSIRKVWIDLLGSDHVIFLEDEENICDTVAS